MSSRRRGTFVIGQQIAEAHANERARLNAGPAAPSPMPVERYDVERGDYSLLSVTPSALDSKLQELTRLFAAGGQQYRGSMTASLSLDDQYTLLHFATRAAVLAVREPRSSWCEDGRLTMIDERAAEPMSQLFVIWVLASQRGRAYRKVRERLSICVSNTRQEGRTQW